MFVAEELQTGWHSSPRIASKKNEEPRKDNIMSAEEHYYFECLRCGTQAHMTDAPPRCPKCCSGNGIVTDRQLLQPVASVDSIAQAMHI